MMKMALDVLYEAEQFELDNIQEDYPEPEGNQQRK